MPTFSFLHREDAGTYSGFDLKAQYRVEHHLGSSDVTYIIEADPKPAQAGGAVVPAECDINHPGGTGDNGAGAKKAPFTQMPFKPLQPNDQLTILANGDLVLEMQAPPQ